MINLKPIAKSVQKRLFEKMKALGKESSYSDDSTGALTQADMMSRSTFIKMVSEQKKPVILMGGELKRFGIEGGGLRGGYDEIYGSRGDNINSDKRPMPGIKSIDVSFNGGARSSRKATINWTCWSFDDITRLTPHFLTPGNTVLLEWGWVYNKNSLIDLPTFIGPNGVRKDAYKDYIGEIEDGKGDFDMMVGVTSNFEYTTRSDGGFDCQTTLMSVGVQLINSTIPNDSLVTEGEILNVDSKEDTKKIIDKIEKTIKGNDDSLLSFDLNVTLKTMIKHLNWYILDQITDSKNNGEVLSTGSVKLKSLGGNEGRHVIGYKKNQFLAIQSKESDNNYEFVYSKLGSSSKGTEEILFNGGEVWIRWGWFEDNILSKFASMTTKNNDDKFDIISQFRSIELIDDILTSGPNGEVIKTNSKGQRYYKSITKDGAEGDAIVVSDYESVKIRSSKFLETIDLNTYILPGKFLAQNPDIYKTKTGLISLEGDENWIQKLSQITNDVNIFKPFEVEGDENLGYLRNMLVNTKQIIAAFGANEKTDTVEYMSLNESMSNLFDKLNAPINLWKFELKQDSIDHDRAKIIDDQTTAVDFTKPMNTQRSVYGLDTLLKHGIFYFPVWSYNSIVKSQNIVTKIPDELQLQVTYGSHLDQIKNKGIPGGFGQKEGIIIGGLGNESKDKHKEGIDFAFKQLQEIGNKNGIAGEPLTPDGGKEHSVVDFLVKRSKGLKKKYEDYKKEKEAHIRQMSYINTSEAVDYDTSKPVPLITFLGKDKEAYFKNVSDENKNSLSSIYGNKYEAESNGVNGKMKNVFINSIEYMVNSNMYETKGSQKNISLLIPLEMELVIDGTGGIYPGNSYHSTYLPKDYRDQSVFQLFDVNHTVSDAGWSTSLSGKMRTTLGQTFKQISKNKQLEDIIENYTKWKGDRTEKPGDGNLYGDDNFVSDTAASSTGTQGLAGQGADGYLGNTADANYDPDGDGVAEIDEIFGENEGGEFFVGPSQPETDTDD